MVKLIMYLVSLEPRANNYLIQIIAQNNFAQVETCIVCKHNTDRKMRVVRQRIQNQKSASEKVRSFEFKQTLTPAVHRKKKPETVSQDQAHQSCTPVCSCW